LYDYALNQYAEIVLFLMFGLITGWLGDQNRREKTRTEQVNKELQAAYAELRQTVNQLLQAERLSSLGEIAAGVVHEICNPLGAIKGAVEIMEDGLEKNSRRREFAEIAKQEIDRLNKLVQEFLHFSRPKNLDKQETDVNELLHSVCLLVEKQAVTQNVKMQEDLSETLPVISIDPEQIKQVLLNLAINALQAMPDGGILICRTRQTETNVFIEIEDTGSGVEENILANIFDPFFTTKEKGLGLVLCNVSF
jgi:signal transduction histidine kinase